MPIDNGSVGGQPDQLVCYSRAGLIHTVSVQQSEGISPPVCADKSELKM